MAALPLDLVDEEDVRKALGLEARVLRRLRRETPQHIAPAWTNVGTTARPRYRWNATEVARWWKELSAWRRFEEMRMVSRSAGETRTGATEASASRRSRRRNGSGRKPSSQKTSASDSNLVSLVDRLTSGRR